MFTERVLVVGCGSIGKRHAKSFAQLSNIAVVDVDADRARLVGEDLSVPWFTQLDEAIDVFSPNAAVLAVPTSLHTVLAEKMIEIGIHVLIEKPLSSSYSDARHFVSVLEKSRCKCFVVCNLRFHPAVACLRENLKRLGRIYFARAHYGYHLPSMRPGVDYRKLYCASKELGGGLVLDCIHEIDYLTWLLGPVEKVYSMVLQSGDLEIDGPDICSSSMFHSTGCISELHLDYLRPHRRRGCEIVGEHGAILWRSEGSPELFSVSFYRKDSGKWEDIIPPSSSQPEKMMTDLASEFLNGLIEEKCSLLTAEEALIQVELANDIQRGKNGY